MKYRCKERSILHRLVVTVLIIVLAQLGIIVLGLFSSGVIQNLQHSSYEILSKTTANRKNYIENEMHNRWCLIDDFIPKFTSYYKEDQSIVRAATPQDIEAYFEKCLPDLISMLRDTNTTGAFIILDDKEEDESTNSCLYLVDSDPTYNDLKNNSDLLLLKGSINLLDKYKIPMHVSWNYGLTLTDDNRQILYKPLEAAKDVKDPKLLGYWHISNSLYDSNSNVITYTQPLIDENGNAFAVVGIEVSQKHVYNLLPENEISANSFSGYAIISQDKNGALKPAMSKGARIKQLIPFNEEIPLKKTAKHDAAYHLSDPYGDDMAVVLQPLSLYNKNSPFEDTKWYLAGIVEEDELVKSSSKLIHSTTIAVVLSAILDIVISALIGISFSRPIAGLVKRIHSHKTGEKVRLDKTGILEIDELSASIEQLTEDVLNSASKTDKIIKMVNLDIGSFEYIMDRDYVQVSDGLEYMLGLSSLKDESGKVSKIDFLNALLDIKQRGCGSNVYQYQDNPPKWLKIDAVRTETSELGIVIDVTKDELARRAIMYERDYDILTGVYNRFAFHRIYKDVFEKEELGCAAFIMADLDNLKYLNDTYGHDTGDVYIKTIASLINDYFKSKKAVYARMSGDEFYIFLYGYELKEDIRKLVYNFYILLNQESITLPDGGSFKLKMSSGIAWYGSDSTDPDQLIHFADFAMYQVKHTIKGGIREFDNKLYSEDSYMITGKEELYTILDSQLLDYVFQPIINASDGSIYGYEALMRPMGKSINTPDKLIHLAQAQGQLWQIEKTTFYTTLELFKKYQYLFGDVKLFINSVPNQVLKENEYDDLERLYPNLLSRVVMEITEHESIDHFPLFKKKELIERWGGLLALDDYGTGFANDMLLINLRPNIIKIDKFIVDDIEWDADKQSILSKTINFARERNTLVLAEGVETRAQFEKLELMGIDLIQGYYVSKPLPMPNYDPSEIQKVIRELSAPPKE